MANFNSRFMYQPLVCLVKVANTAVANYSTRRGHPQYPSNAHHVCSPTVWPCHLSPKRRCLLHVPLIPGGLTTVGSREHSRHRRPPRTGAHRWYSLDSWNPVPMALRPACYHGSQAMWRGHVQAICGQSQRSHHPNPGSKIRLQVNLLFLSSWGPRCHGTEVRLPHCAWIQLNKEMVYVLSCGVMCYEAVSNRNTLNQTSSSVLKFGAMGGCT